MADLGASEHVCDVAGCEEGFARMAEVIEHERTHRGAGREPLREGDIGVVMGALRGRNRTDAKVVKVGRRWATVEPSWLGRFDIETGRQDSDFGSPAYFYTPEQMVLRDQLAAADEVIKGHDIHPWDLRSKWTDEDRLALAAWLEERFDGR